MLRRTITEYSIKLDPADELAPAEFSCFLDDIEKSYPNADITWGKEGHEFTVIVEKVCAT